MNLESPDSSSEIHHSKQLPFILSGSIELCDVQTKSKSWYIFSTLHPTVLQPLTKHSGLPTLQLNKVLLPETPHILRHKLGLASQLA